VTDDGLNIDREGIHIDPDLAAEIAIEDELDANVEGEYTFPDPRRRRASGWVYLVAAAVSTVTFEGGWMVAVGFVVLGVWQFLASWPLNINEHDALKAAASAVGFPVGHASASVRFRGWRSRPRWSVVLYSATEPPDQRALVVVDAVDGQIAEKPFVEDVSQQAVA